MPVSTKLEKTRSASCSRNGCQSAKLAADLSQHLKLTDLVREFWFAKDYLVAQDMQEDVAEQLHKVLRMQRRSQAGVLVLKILGEYPSFKQSAERAVEELRKIQSDIRAVKAGECSFEFPKDAMKRMDLDNSITVIMRSMSLLHMLNEII